MRCFSAASSGSQSSAQTGPLPAGLPIGPSAAALAAARSVALAHQSVYESLGRPPAIRHDIFFRSHCSKRKMAVAVALWYLFTPAALEAYSRTDPNTTPSRVRV